MKALYINSIAGTGTPINFTVSDDPTRYARLPNNVRLSSVRIPYAWNNVTISNNSLRLVEDGSSVGFVQITIAPGIYSPADLAAALATALTAAGTQKYTVELRDGGKRMAILADESFTLFFPDYPSIAPLLGFLSSASYSGSTIVSPVPLVRSLDNEVFICADIVSGIDNGYSVPSIPAANNSILAIVPTCLLGADNIPAIMYNASISAPFFPVTGTWIQNGQIHFWLQLPSGIPISLANNWSLVLEFS